jgi:hypothetical protein
MLYYKVGTYCADDRRYNIQHLVKSWGLNAMHKFKILTASVTAALPMLFDVSFNPAQDTLIFHYKSRSKSTIRESYFQQINSLWFR